MERVYIKHSYGCKPFRVRAMRLGVVLAHLICFSFIILPLSHADTIWLRNGKKLSNVTVIEETEADMVLQFRGGRTRTVLRSTVVGGPRRESFQAAGRPSSGASLPGRAR